VKLQEHGWRGLGRFRVAFVDGRLVIRFDGLTTRQSRLKSQIGDFFRKRYRTLRPSYEPFQVCIWIETSGAKKRVDVDNVAKVCLDSLTGVIWHDESQVMGQQVRKVLAEADAVTLAVAQESVQKSAQDSTSTDGDELGRLMQAIEPLTTEP